MRDLSHLLKSFSGDTEMIVRTTELRDKLIAYELADRKGIAFKAGQWVKAAIGGQPEAARWCRENKIALMKATATSPNQSGGALVPEQVAGAILLLAEAYGTARSEARKWNLGSDSQVVPRSTGFIAGWITENSTASTTQATFDGVGLTVKKLGLFTTISSELMEDAGESLGEFFIDGSALACATAEDGVLFNGDGTSAFSGGYGIGPKLISINGPSKVTAASGHNTYALLDQTDIGSAIAALPARAMRNAKIFCSITAYGDTLVRLSGANGGLVATIGPDGELQANYHGFPVVICPALPTSTSSLSGKLMMAVGDMRQAVAFGARRDLTVQRFDQRFADLDQILLRMTERVAVVSHDLGNASTAGALVGLFAP